jgi:hypothetical protein
VTRAPLAVVSLLVFVRCRALEPSPPQSPTPTPTSTTAEAWTDLFDGHSLDGWKESGFGGGGKIEVVDAKLLIGQGSPMSGATWSGDAARGLPSDLARDGYELEVEAARTLGTDFFCGLTFPVGDAHLTLVIGGWGGALCGLSCLDGADAASNETKSFRRIERGRAYRIRVRVADGRVAAWLDDERLADVAIAGRHLSLRPEVEPSKPLGIATYATAAAITKVRWRRIFGNARG